MTSLFLLPLEPGVGGETKGTSSCIPMLIMPPPTSAASSLPCRCTHKVEPLFSTAGTNHMQNASFKNPVSDACMHTHHLAASNMTPRPSHHLTEGKQTSLPHPLHPHHPSDLDAPLTSDTRHRHTGCNHPPNRKKTPRFAPNEHEFHPALCAVNLFVTSHP